MSKHITKRVIKVWRQERDGVTVIAAKFSDNTFLKKFFAADQIDQADILEASLLRRAT